MPRQARIDVPGMLHHVMARGIEGRKIFLDDMDRKYFLKQLSEIVLDNGAEIYGWALMPNHFHLLIESGKAGLARLMRQLLTRYAVYFNKRNERSGHLFQNRYKSIVCERDSYLLTLVRYIHLNPVKAGIANGVEGLAAYPWSGHRTLIGLSSTNWQNVKDVLSLFGDNRKQCIDKYLAFLREGVCLSENYEGGGLMRSMGGVSSALASLKQGKKEFYDERVLGSGEFVKQLLGSDGVKCVGGKNINNAHCPGITELIQRLAKRLGLSVHEIKSNKKTSEIAKARSIIAFIAQSRLGEKGSVVARELMKTRASVSLAYTVGKQLYENSAEIRNVLDDILTN